MEGSIRLTDEDRKNLLRVYRSGNGGRVVHRAQILLLLADGLATAMCGGSSSAALI